jgi:hypothetical protein
MTKKVIFELFLPTLFDILDKDVPGPDKKQELSLKRIAKAALESEGKILYNNRKSALSNLLF